MAYLLSSVASHEALPDSFVFPPDQRPPASAAVVALPVIDLSGPRDEVRRAILEAGKELGFFQVHTSLAWSALISPFYSPPVAIDDDDDGRPTDRPTQVINHGVPEDAVRDMETCCDEFFRLPAEDKAAFYSDDTDKPNRLFSSTIYGIGGERYWRDCLRLACGFPYHDTARSAWPDKPGRLRDVMERFVVPTRAVGMELLRLLCEGMGLRPDYFEGGLSAGDVIVNVNHYPPCPDPARTLGLPPHCDRNLITLLLQGSVPGLQVSYRGDWIRAQLVPGAFIVNFGHQLEIATNGLLKSIEHRAAPNGALPRTSVATFIMPTEDCLVAPAEELVDGEGNPPRYRAVTFREFMKVYKTVGARRESVEKAFKI
ncbi:2'-deoxymugineic-acid 2'-dioxygenase [Dichanthelium oligosanthes]|uniref:2'-deoxymugineic-acid 2'-dioxygenase n=1 Tax=Dichanthelium oligosanthes TaxID=888268 RepID=A0A1E5UKL8_9POAL|nr:2'-deoxymugineic-acid 2'-dioxygenase [Dichanthelium oligosanthes]